MPLAIVNARSFHKLVRLKGTSNASIWTNMKDLPMKFRPPIGTDDNNKINETYLVDKLHNLSVKLIHCHTINHLALLSGLDT